MLKRSRIPFVLGVTLSVVLVQGSVESAWCWPQSPANDDETPVADRPATSAPTTPLPEVAPRAGDDETPDAVSTIPAGESPAILAGVGSRVLSFAPSDNDASGSVIDLMNTTNTQQTVLVRAYADGHVLVYSLDVNVPPHLRLRLASDSLASGPPPSWDVDHLVITNFTDFSRVGQLTVPDGVAVDGYFLFNPGTGVVDPRADQGAIPFRFLEVPSSCSRRLIFTPEDNDATATQITVYNTTSSPETVHLRAYASTGALGLTLDQQVAPGQTLHMVSDSVAASPPPSWDTPNVAITNYTDFLSYATLTLPGGVGYDGYEVFNSSTGVVDPRADQGGLPLAFTDDPTYDCVVFIDGFESGNSSRWSATSP